MAKKIKKPSETNTHWKNLFEYDYLGSHNLLPGEELVCKITKIGKEEVAKKARKKGEADKEILPILYFEGKVPKMVLNKTNATTISKLYSPYTDRWIGKTVQIFATEVNAFGEKVSALRIRDFVPDDTDTVDVSAEIAAMNEVKTLKELQAYFVALPNDKKGHPEVVKLKDQLKTTLK
jgi:hypothetical protein